MPEIATTVLPAKGASARQLPSSIDLLQNLESALAQRIIEANFEGKKDLSPRELEILLHTIDGAQDKEIAHRLSIATSTVKNIAKGLRAKMHARDKVDVTRITLLSLIPTT